MFIIIFFFNFSRVVQKYGNGICSLQSISLNDRKAKFSWELNKSILMNKVPAGQKWPRTAEYS